MSGGVPTVQRIAFVYDDVFLRHEMPLHHPESSQRLQAIVRELRSSGVWDRVTRVLPAKSSLEAVAAVHSERYVHEMVNMAPGYLDPDTYVSEGTCEAALHAAGAVGTAIDGIVAGQWTRAFCAVRPPGHHAERARGMGFCIFNNVAVGARHAQARGYEKVLIADFDVHHGNGTQDIFYDDPSVFYFSTHQFPYYPGTGGENERGSGDGLGFNLNVPLPSGAGDEEISRAYAQAFASAAAQFQPDCVLVSAGYDLLAGDPLAGLVVTPAGLQSVVASIISAAGDAPVICTLEGGYDLHGLASGVRQTVEIMLAD
jgi:acetoin utilization deacetylase AcuC-like enzyme